MKEEEKTGNTTAQEELIYRCFLPDLTGFEKLSLHRSRYGERGIRTLGTLPGTHDFQSCTFDHSDISPKCWKHLKVLQFSRCSVKRIKKENAWTCNSVKNGERGIRTPGTLRYNGFRDRPIRPLSHLSSSMRLGGLEPPTFRSAIWRSDPTEL